MKNLLEKMQLIQYMIILIFSIISKSLTENTLNIEDRILYKNSEYYLFLKKIVEYNQICNKYIKYIRHNKELPINNNDKLLENNDYFYLFYNRHNMYIYFYKEKNSNIHNIYFNGINNTKDLNIIYDTVSKVITNKFHFEHVSNLIDKKGILYKINCKNISKIIFINNNLLKKIH